jgi:hypothetical protein
MLFIVDTQLNLDPTDEDVVMFSVLDSSGTNSTVAWTNGTIPWEWATGTNIVAEKMYNE